MIATYDVVTPLFEQFVDTQTPPEVIADGFTWVEGPVWFDNGLYFSHIPAKKLYRWDKINGLSVVIADTDFANGNTTDVKQPHIISCEHGGRRVLRRKQPISSENSEVVASHFKGKRLNSPNDVVVKSDGTIWFTDPPYGILSNNEGYQADSEIGSNNVYRVDLDGTVHCVVSDFERPNGLAFSPDEKILYVADSGSISGSDFPPIVDHSKPHHIRAFDVHNNTLSNSRVVTDVEPGVPDGFRVDTQGYLWVSSADSLRCYSDQGELIGRIVLPEVVSNCCFGGADGSDLFITASSRVYRVRTNRQGAESLYRS